MKDLTDPGAGKVIRVKPNAYGQDVRTMITQLPVVDATQGHVANMAVIESLMQRVSGVVDSVMGMPKQGGRQTATEVRTSSGFSINRLKTTAEYMSAQGFAPHSAKIVQNTMQFYDQEQTFRVAGSLPPGMNPFMVVNKDLIAGNYDFVAVDGTLPVDKFALVTMWTQLLGAMEKFPQLMGQYDIGAIINYVAQLGGVKNLKQFQVNVVPDQQLAASAAAGNSVPMANGNPNRATRSPALSAQPPRLAAG